MFNRLRMVWWVLTGNNASYAKLNLPNGEYLKLMPGEEFSYPGAHMRMCCPFCFHRMTRSDRKEDWHVDPTGNAQYSCTNDNCHDRPRYRRVDVLDAAMDQQAQARADKQASEHEAFERLTAMENRLTTWMRERYKGYFRGQFGSVAEIAIYVMSKGADGHITSPLSDQQAYERDQMLDRSDEKA